MHARVTRFAGPVDNIEQGLKHVRENAVPAVRQLAGFKGILYLLDRTSGSGLAVTLWQDESALAGSKQPAEEIRSEAIDASGAAIQSVDEYEVVVHEI